MDLATGQVVEFLENQRFTVAACLGKKGSRYHLITHLGREVNLAPGRFLHVSPDRIDVTQRYPCIKKLQRINLYREELKGKVDIEELWELVNEEKEEWSPKELAELTFSSAIDQDHVAALIRAVIDDHTYFKYREGKIIVLPPLVVERLLDQRKKEAERLRLIAEGSKWLEALWSDETGRIASSGTASADNRYVDFWLEAIKDYCIHGEESKHAMSVKGLMKQAGLSGPRIPFDTLVKAGIWSEDENLEILRHEIDTEFSPEAMEQARQLAEKRVDPLENGRVDLRNLETVTIDGPESLDLDDALSFREVRQGWEVGVHITDIGLELRPGTPLFLEAINRATTIYLPDQQIPMLPEILSQDAWSLKAGEDRRAISFFVILDSKGRIIDRRIERSVINVHERLTYDEARKRIDRRENLSKLYELCVERQKRRISNGALPLPIPELVIHVDENKRVSVEITEPGPARFLVAECMILANYMAALFLRDRSIPALYRSQPPPREQIIEGGETNLLANFRQRRLISRGNLGPEPVKHHGLGLDVYTTITSPLRRGLDLLMQQQIASFMATGTPLHTEDDLANLAIYLKQGLAAAAAVNQGRTRYWLLKYLEGLKGKVLKAWILEKGPRKLLAVLQETLTPFELPSRPEKEYNLDDEIEVKIKKVNPRENILKLEWH